MTSIALHSAPIFVGVDTHKAEHVAVALDDVGRQVGELFVPANNAGYECLLIWAHSIGRPDSFGVEGCGSYGIGLYRFLRRSGERVIEVNRPARKGERRLSGKSDLIDADHAARELLAGRAATIPKTADGSVEAIRLVRVARNTAVKAQTSAMIALKATLVTASSEMREQFEPLSNYRLVTACAALEPTSDLSGPEAAMRYALASLAGRWLQLHEEVKAHNRHLKKLTLEVAPELVDAFGIGPDIAGELLVAAGDNSCRVRSEAAFAKLCGVSPIPASSGQTQRHRLNRGGNRQANAALYRAVVVRMRWHEPTIEYVRRRTCDGLTKKDIIRCLKRYLAREVYGLLPPPT